MGEWGVLKPILSSLVLPPAGPILWILAFWLGGMLAPRWKGASRAGISLGLAGLWLLSCNGFAVWLSQNSLPQYAAIKPVDLKKHNIQAVIVLGGGVDQWLPEYDAPDLSPPAYMRLRYGAHLARTLGLPLGFAGGIGWSTHGADHASEAQVAARIAAGELGVSIRHLESSSRDTRENAQHMKDVLAPTPIRRIALVTHAWHMPRAVRHFEAAGFTVLPAPMGYVLQAGTPANQWLPSAVGLRDSTWVLREKLGLLLTTP
jgi:uncharacterized SAM-binding protein YcdF (DUF218 family)